MQDPPSILELLGAAREHLQSQVIPELADPGVRFRTRVAANVLAIAERELGLDQVQAEAELRRLRELVSEDSTHASIEELTRKLNEQVAAGEFDDASHRRGLMAHLMQTVIEKLKISNPKFLERVLNED